MCTTVQRTINNYILNIRLIQPGYVFVVQIINKYENNRWQISK